MKIDNFLSELKRRNVYKVAIAYAGVAWLTIQAASIFLPCIQCAAMGDEGFCARLKRRRNILIFFTVTAEACIVDIDEHAWRNRSCRGRVAAGTKAGVNAFPGCAPARQWGENAATARLFFRRNRKLDRP